MPRQQFQTELKVSPGMKLLLARAKAKVENMPEEELEEMLREQRISFAYGNLPVGNTSTKDDVRRAAKHISLR